MTKHCHLQVVEGMGVRDNTTVASKSQTSRRGLAHFADKRDQAVMGSSTDGNHGS